MRKDFEEVDQQIKVMIGKIQETRKEAQQAISGANSTSNNYQQAQDDYRDRIETI